MFLESNYLGPVGKARPICGINMHDRSLVYHKVTTEMSERVGTFCCWPCFGDSVELSCSLFILSNRSLVYIWWPPIWCSFHRFWSFPYHSTRPSTFYRHLWCFSYPANSKPSIYCHGVVQYHIQGWQAEGRHSQQCNSGTIYGYSYNQEKLCMFWKRFEVQIQEMKEYVIHFVSVHIDAKFEWLNS